MCASFLPSSEEIRRRIILVFLVFACEPCMLVWAEVLERFITVALCLRVYKMLMTFRTVEGPSKRFSANSFPWIRFSIYQATMPPNMHRKFDQFQCRDFGGCAQRRLVDGTDIRANDNSKHVKLSIFSHWFVLQLVWTVLRTTCIHVTYTVYGPTKKKRKHSKFPLNKTTNYVQLNKLFNWKQSMDICLQLRKLHSSTM